LRDYNHAEGRTGKVRIGNKSDETPGDQAADAVLRLVSTGAGTEGLTGDGSQSLVCFASEEDGDGMPIFCSGDIVEFGDEGRLADVAEILVGGLGEGEPVIASRRRRPVCA